MVMSSTLSVGCCETKRLQPKMYLIYSSGQPELSARRSWREHNGAINSRNSPYVTFYCCWYHRVILIPTLHRWHGVAAKDTCGFIAHVELPHSGGSSHLTRYQIFIRVYRRVVILLVRMAFQSISLHCPFVTYTVKVNTGTLHRSCDHIGISSSRHLQFFWRCRKMVKGDY